MEKFDGKTVARIYFNNIDRSEQRIARRLICRDEDVEALRAAGRVFKALKFFPGVYGKIGLGADFLFSGAAKILEDSRNGKLENWKGTILGALIPADGVIAVPAELRLKRIQVSPGGG